MYCQGGEGTSATGETIREGECTGWDLERDEERMRSVEEQSALV